MWGLMMGCHVKTEDRLTLIPLASEGDAGVRLG